MNNDTSTLENKLTSCLEQLQQRIADMWKGREKEALIALTRALDCTMTDIIWNNTAGTPIEVEQKKRSARILKGSATAFRPLLSAIKGQAGAVPLNPSSLQISSFAYSYLYECGALAHLRRTVALERYGLAYTRQLSQNHFLIEISSSDAAEQASRIAMKLISRDAAPTIKTTIHWEQIYKRMKKFVNTSDQWFIRYKNDNGIVMAYREKARLYGQNFLEAEALPNDVIIGDRTFGEWKRTCDHALGRVLAHMDFAILLKNKKTSVAMENILTMFARREDVEAVWMQAGLSAELLAPTMQALTLEIDDLDEWEKTFESTAPFYIDLGRDFLLLPCFGALGNPYYALFRHLRKTYKADWGRAVDLREEIFRAELTMAFPKPKFMIPTNGFQIRRHNGSSITDLDAVILDTESGELALVQLKWHDIFGSSLNERESRRKNIARANDWVERVSTWVDGRTSQELASALKLKGKVSQCPPLIYVIARYTARFAGDISQDPRAFWLGWSEILLASKAEPNHQSPLSRIPDWIAIYQKQFERSETISEDFLFPNFKVTLQVNAHSDSLQQS